MIKSFILIFGFTIIFLGGHARSEETGRYNAFGTRCYVYVTALEKAVQESAANKNIPFEKHFDEYWDFIAGWLPNLFNAPRFEGLTVGRLVGGVAQFCREYPDAELLNAMEALKGGYVPR